MTEQVIHRQIHIPSAIQTYLGLLCSSAGKESACSAGDPGSIPGLERPLEKDSILAWRIPWTEEPGRLQSMGSQELNTT